MKTFMKSKSVNAVEKMTFSLVISVLIRAISRAVFPSTLESSFTNQNLKIKQQLRFTELTTNHATIMNLKKMFKPDWPG